MDDILFFFSSAADLLEMLRQLFSLCRKFNLKLHANKFQLFLGKVKWFGRIIDGERFQLDPEKPDILLEMPVPTKGDKLHRFDCDANWMRTCIPQFTNLTAPLSNMLESLYSPIGKRTKRAVVKFNLMELGLKNQHKKSFKATISSLAN